MSNYTVSDKSTSDTWSATEHNLLKVAANSKSEHTADYIIELISSVIYARPRPGLTAYSGSDAYTVIQAAIDALTPMSTVGTGGGKIHLCKGTYSLTDELHIVGWEDSIAPFSELTIEGEGLNTMIIQNTSAKNGLKINNAAGVNLKNFKISCGSSARSAILLADDGPDFESSMFKGSIDGLYLSNNNASYPAFYMKNFMNLNVGFLVVHNIAGDAIIMENNSTTILYGNSSFAHLKLSADATVGHGLLVKSATTTKFINICAFKYFEVAQGLYGLRTQRSSNFTFDFVDIENVTHPISLGTQGTTTNNNSYGYTFTGGYILPNPECTSIHCSLYAHGNKFVNVWIDGDFDSIPILDEQEYRNPNSYEVNLGYDIDPTKISILTTTETILIYRSNSEYQTKIQFPNRTKGYTQALGDSTTLLATTAFTMTNGKNYMARVLSALGSPLKGWTVGGDITDATITMVINDSEILYLAVWLDSAVELTGVTFFQRTQGVYTADNNNKVGLYSYSGGTLTKVAESANNGNLFKGTADTFVQQAFSTPYTPTVAGLYYVAFIYNQSAQSTQPAIAAYYTQTASNQAAPLTSNSAKLYGSSYSTDLPSSIAMSSIDGSIFPFWLGVY